MAAGGSRPTSVRPAIAVAIVQLSILTIQIAQPLNSNHIACAKTSGNSVQINECPRFENVNFSMSYLVKSGRTILLPCVVRNLGKKVVSWIRHQDLHILTFGSYSFSNDDRFQAVHSTAEDFWGLRIRGTLFKDTGKYECQVNTEPKIGFIVYLKVTDDEPAAQVEKSPTLSIDEAGPVVATLGCSVALTCKLRYLHAIRHDAFNAEFEWMHNGTRILFPVSGKPNHPLISTYKYFIPHKHGIDNILTISNISFKNSGQYWCTANNRRSNIVDVHVNDTDGKVAAFQDAEETMQKDSPPAKLLSSVTSCSDSARHHQCNQHKLIALLGIIGLIGS